MKTDSPIPSIFAIMVTLCLLALTAYCIKIDYKSKKDIYSYSISETVSITPTTIPTEQPTKPIEAFSDESDINSLPLPKNVTGAFKAWESADSITRQDSKQWHLKQLYWFDSYGFARIGQYYAVAMGTFYAEHIGQTFIIELESRTIKVIIGDIKADKDTVDRMYCRTNKSIVEFIIKDGAINSDRLNEIMAGRILSIRREN